MKILSKKKLAISVASLVGTMGLVSSANAVHFPTDGLGDALMNYYTVNDGRSTLINYTNTSDQTIALRVRLHEALNSRPVDFTVILSPYDVWNATITEGGNGVGPVIFTGDESCTIPKIGNSLATANRLATAFAAAGATGPRINEGYVAAIVMASKDGEPLDCRNSTAALDSEEELFTNTRDDGFDTLMWEYGEYTNNAIKGVYNLLNVPEGQNAAAGMTTLANFFARGETPPEYQASVGASGFNPAYPASATINEMPTGGLKSLVTLQLPPNRVAPLGDMTAEQRYLASFYLPSLASANTQGTVLLGDTVVGRSQETGAAAVSYLFNRTNVINMWTAFDGDWNTATDLVIQSYVKAYFVDDRTYDSKGNETTPQIAGRYKWRPGVPAVNIIKNGVNPGPFNEYFDPVAMESCDPVDWYVMDREENVDPAEPKFSPEPTSGREICRETNVISFNAEADGAVVDARRPLGSALAPIYNINSSFANGWIEMDLRSAGNAFGTDQTRDNPINPSTGLGNYYGLPIDSFAFTTRMRAGGLNEAIIVPSAYFRTVADETLTDLAPNP